MRARLLNKFNELTLTLTIQSFIVVIIALLGFDRGYFSQFAVRFQQNVLFALITSSSFILHMLCITTMVKRNSWSGLSVGDMCVLHFALIILAAGFRGLLAFCKAYVPILSPLTLVPIVWAGLPAYAAYLATSAVAGWTETGTTMGLFCALLAPPLTLLAAIGGGCYLKNRSIRRKEFKKGKGKHVKKTETKIDQGTRTKLESELIIKGCKEWTGYLAYFENSRDPRKAMRDLEHDVEVARKYNDERRFAEICTAIRHIMLHYSDVLARGTWHPSETQPPTRPTTPPTTEPPTAPPAKVPPTPPAMTPPQTIQVDRKLLFEDIVSFRIFGNVVGLERAKEVVVWKFLVPLLFPERAPGVEPRVGMLLYGPPGVGKSELVKSLAEACRRLDIQTLMLKPTDANKPVVGADAKVVEDLFEEAKKRPSVIIIDEALSVLGKRQEIDSRYHQAAFEAFLQGIDSSISDKNMKVLVVACTNRPDLIDAATLRPGRLGEKVYVPPPDGKGRIELFKVFLSDKPVEGNVDFEKLAAMTEPNQIGYYSGDDIREICREALVDAYKSGRKALTMADLEAAIAKRPPSIIATTLALYDEYEYRTGKTEKPSRPAFYG